MRNFKTKDIYFDNNHRTDRLKVSLEKEYDLLVIGGGITGAGIALDATLRGLSVLLVEKRDFASGTSSKSTKLIHGGLRYLKQLEFGLVKETGLERAIAHHNIPHLVHPEKMLLPIVKNGTFSKFSASFAISVYDMLARVPEKDRKKSYNKKGTLEIEPLLNPSILKSGIQYSEYRTDDARLTIELIKAARRESGEAYNYMEVSEFIYEANHVVGVVCNDLIAEQTVNFRARQVVSAAGPWVDELRDENKSKQGKSLQLTKGVHIVLPKEKLPIKRSVYFDAFDGRMMFAIPRGKVTYVGTSDTNYNGDKDRVVCTTLDAEYILKAINQMFEVDSLSKNDIISTWAGLRPLIHEAGKSASELSRKDEIFISNTGLISIAGGKLTGFRKMAERVVDLVLEKHDSIPFKACQTKNYKIHSDSFKNYQAFENFIDSLKEKSIEFPLTSYEAWYLATTYGKHAASIIAAASKSKLEKDKALLSAEIEFCIRYESCYLPDDYFNRRSGRIYFNSQSLDRNLTFIVDEFSKIFGWSQNQLGTITANAKTYFREATEILT